MHKKKGQRRRERITAAVARKQQKKKKKNPSFSLSGSLATILATPSLPPWKRKKRGGSYWCSLNKKIISRPGVIWEVFKPCSSKPFWGHGQSLSIVSQKIHADPLMTLKSDNQIPLHILRNRWLRSWQLEKSFTPSNGTVELHFDSSGCASCKMIKRGSRGFLQPL